MELLCFWQAPKICFIATVCRIGCKCSEAQSIMSIPTVLILGARGRLGCALTDAFNARQWQVLAQSRKATFLASGDAQIVADVRDTAAITRAAQAASSTGTIDVVVNATNPLYTRWAEEAPAMNEAAITIARALNATLMFPGNVYNFGADLPERLEGATPQIAQTKKGRIRIAMEQALAIAAAQGAQVIVIRAGDFYGCNTSSWFDQAIAKDAHKGKLTYPGVMDLPHAWAYVPDLAASFVRVADARHTLRSFENIHFAGHTVAGNTLREAMERALQRTVKVSGLPWPLIRAVGLVYPLWRELAEMAYLWQKPHQLVTDPAHVPLIAASTPFDEAIARSVAALQMQLPSLRPHVDDVVPPTVRARSR
jgi:nucleoside-diphosphate-sugar epimerase